MLFFEYFSIYPLIAALSFCILRLFFFVEFPYTKIVNSQKILPFIQTFLCTRIGNLGHININLGLIIVCICGFRSVLIIFKYIRSDILFKQFLNSLPKVDDKRLYDIFSIANSKKTLKNIKIIVHDSIESPAIFGLIEPIILLPNINFSNDELLCIFTHEIAHFQLGHNIIKYIVRLICACFWWNPCFKDMSSEISHILEMHSDTIVCKKMNTNQKIHYLSAILKTADHLTSHASIPMTTCSLIEDKNNEKIQQRFKMILGGYYDIPQKHDFVTLPIIILLFFFSYYIVFQPYSLPQQDCIGAYVEIHPDYYLVETDDGYDLYDSSDNFIAQIGYIDESLRDLKIYKN